MIFPYPRICGMEFQSIPAPKGWWNFGFFSKSQDNLVSIHTSPERLVKSFDSERGLSFQLVSIHTSPERLVKWLVYLSTVRHRWVSIHTSPERLVKSLVQVVAFSRDKKFQSIPAPKGWWNVHHLNCENRTGQSFNPYQPRKAGEMPASWPLNICFIVVSIHTSPERLVKYLQVAAT